MFRCILTVLSFTMSIPVVLVSFALQRKRDTIHWEYCAHDVTQSMSLLLRLKIIQYCAVNNIFPSQNWCWVKKNVCALECATDFMSSSVEDAGMSYVNICILHVRNCTTGGILFSSDVPAFLFFSHSSPVNHSFVSPWCSAWQTKASMCPVFLVSHHVLP